MCQSSTSAQMAILSGVDFICKLYSIFSGICHTLESGINVVLCLLFFGKSWIFEKWLQHRDSARKRINF